MCRRRSKNEIVIRSRKRKISLRTNNNTPTIQIQVKPTSDTNKNLAPIIRLTNHIDSTAQVAIDKKEIVNALINGTIDTTGSNQGVYYKIIHEGTGPMVDVTDTLTVHYKGSLLKDGSVFDQTKDKPATFPLSRLIKGWQNGLTKCKVGGKIRLIIPSGLAYSVRHRSKAIPPNSVLVFDIEVLSAKKL